MRLLFTTKMSLDGTLGTIVIGAAVGTVLFGIMTMQTFNYYDRYSKDPARLKVLVCRHGAPSGLADDFPDTKVAAVWYAAYPKVIQEAESSGIAGFWSLGTRSLFGMRWAGLLFYAVVVLISFSCTA